MSDATGPVTDARGNRLDQIRLTGVSATGYHGVFEHEKRDGQTFVVDVVVHLDTRRAAAGDDLRHTLHYGELAELVVAVIEGPAYDLIETLAERIAATVLADGTVSAVDVAVHKPQAPIAVPFGDVVVAIRRDRTKLPAAEPYVPPVTAPPTHAVGAVEQPLEIAPLDVAPLVVPPLEPPTGTAQLPVAPDDQPTTAFTVPDLEAPAPIAAPADDEVVGEVVTDRLDVAPDAPVDAVLAFGANLGNAQETLRAAITEIGQVPGIEIVDVSPLARTAPVGGPDQPDFLNAVVLVRTSLAPRELLRAAQAVEQAHGRERLEHWGPRTLDVDLIVYGTVLAVTEDLELPHPRAHERAFVLQPWAQVDPDAFLPGLGGGPVAALAATAPDREGVRWLALDWLTAPLPAAHWEADAGPRPGGPGA
ncbi:2-amino-4-hydroxy-6-hydroxymethyldihydropteridine diphosphokinase [Cellulomonas sp. DKR-3]|uniref:Bifunctional folate synthesis protein n=1 Tax=Cellulomonas fulva TaxID=2835530 RepID=A0ABS5TVS4_9CELL|nr:2-amino-4-hydroxy-6-hydroxymethyldihydropteridine diphosphokinase [Cellulomonas fulva]MBT0993207.1 2-amino-4-hydroxy-6-hydroxymethyldihydropteridine diphosphokinase [Cellulomonas fulva]